MTAWWSEATRVASPLTGGDFVGAPWRIVLHTTEGSSIEGAEASYRSSTSYPHFTIDATRIHQHIGIDRAARALLHPAGTAQTNRMNAIQIEIVGHATDSTPVSDPLRRLVAWIRLQVKVEPTAPVFKPYPSSYGSSSVRFSDDMWRNFSGICGHQHVPHNDHGDPGAMDLHDLLGVAPMYDPPIVMQPVVADAGVPGTGYRYLLAADGGVFSFGGAPFHGSPVSDPRVPAGVKWAQIEADMAGYTCITTTNLRFGYPH